MKKVAVVGGIPQPVGGVTTFLRRVLVNEDAVTHFFDMYPGRQKDVPSEYKGKYICCKLKLFTWLNLLFFLLLPGEKVVHFNFSTPRALLVLGGLPKCGKKWILMLHHGSLDSGSLGGLSGWIIKRKMDIVIAMNESQLTWYSKFLSRERIKTMSSYSRPASPDMGKDLLVSLKLSEARASYNKVIVCSGYPTAIYRHLLAIELMDIRVDDFLFCCIYGDGADLSKIEVMAAARDNVMLCKGLNESQFSALLMGSDLYLRLNQKDSFGIAVGDAINFGVPCVATNVCRRYRGAVLVECDINRFELSHIVSKVFAKSLDLVLESQGVEEFSYKALGV
ncbi:glycosyltransferase [Halopseudomonas laoshanensis]|uniref:glycosyltransferase n=1 Tax=Halopseudomonas laoshanensis TaxID=2268758 RepID=UPI003734EA62